MIRARESRPGGRSQAAESLSAPLHSLVQTSANVEAHRRARLRRDLLRLADRYRTTDPGVAALAHAWAVAA